jgi:hypothetical protein
MKMSSRCQTGCQMAAHHWVFIKVDRSKASEAAVPSEMTFHSPPLDFCCLLYLFCSELSLQPIGSWVKNFIPNIQQASMDPILSDFIP